MTDFIKKLESNENLSFEESKTLFSNIMGGIYDEISIIKILEFLSRKGETKNELAGGIFIMRSMATTVNAPAGTIDTCGTGGDGKNSLNISTASAIVLSSMGLKVAKHGNKAVSSNCGSADVLEALKIKINLNPEEAEKSIEKVNFAFMFAPNYHKAMRYVASARMKIAKKTIFNLIGPLSSPAQVKKQVVGVFDKKWMTPFAEALKENKVENAMIVHSEDGMEYNAKKIVDIFKGEVNEFSQAVALNVAAGLIVSGKESNFKNAFQTSTQHLNSCFAYKHLLKIQSI